MPKINFAILNVDFQNDFVLPGAPYEIQGSYLLWPKLRSLFDHARQKKIPIYHIVRIYKEDGSNADLCRRHLLGPGHKMVRAGSPGADILADLFPSPLSLATDTLLEGGIQRLGEGEAILYKPRWSAFYQTALEEDLRARGITSLAVVGCNYPNCPRATIYDASARDFHLTLLTDAISNFTDKDAEELARIGVRLMETEHWIEECKGRRK